MNFGVINILLQFVMLKEDMKLPKSYIFEIAPTGRKLVFQMPNKHMNMHYKLINLKLRNTF